MCHNYNTRSMEDAKKKLVKDRLWKKYFQYSKKGKCLGNCGTIIYAKNFEVANIITKTDNDQPPHEIMKPLCKSCQTKNANLLIETVLVSSLDMGLENINTICDLVIEDLMNGFYEGNVLKRYLQIVDLSEHETVPKHCPIIFKHTDDAYYIKEWVVSGKTYHEQKQIEDDSVKTTLKTMVNNIKLSGAYQHIIHLQKNNKEMTKYSIVINDKIKLYTDVFLNWYKSVKKNLLKYDLSEMDNIETIYSYLYNLSEELLPIFKISNIKIKVVG
jgi:hypothetical protein